MDIRVFNDIFVNKKIDKRIMITVEIVLFASLLIMIICFNNFYDYYNGKGEINNKNIISTLVLTSDIDLIKKNKSMKIDNKEYAYKIKNIESENYVSNGYIYKIVNIKVDNYEELDNNYVDYQIIRKKDTIINYFINTIKGG